MIKIRVKNRIESENIALMMQNLEEIRRELLISKV